MKDSYSYGKGGAKGFAPFASLKDGSPMQSDKEVLYNGQWVKAKHLRAYVYKVNPNSETGFDQMLANSHAELVGLKNLGWFETKSDAENAHISSEVEVIIIPKKPRRKTALVDDFYKDTEF